MRKTIVVCLLLLLFCTLFAGCHTHNWSEATCTKPKTCIDCGDTEGEPLGHLWSDATCTTPKTCSRCGATEGEALGHDWKDATCTEAKTCSRCGVAKGDALGHNWESATCTEAKTCSRCGLKEGKALGHKVEEWAVIKEASCTEKGLQEGVCTVCGDTIQEEIQLLDHVPGDWEITKPATMTAKGTREIHCVNCGKILKSESYSLSAEEYEAAYKDACIKVTFDDLSRDPDKYKGQLVVVTGEVIQAMDASSAQYYCSYRVDITKGAYGWYSDTVYINYDGYGKTPRILEDDIVTFWGKFQGLTSYESIMGQTITLPYIIAEYVKIK